LIILFRKIFLINLLFKTSSKHLLQIIVFNWGMNSEFVDFINVQLLHTEGLFNCFLIFCITVEMDSSKKIISWWKAKEVRIQITFEVRDIIETPIYLYYKLTKIWRYDRVRRK
jgi:hypothetical protein